MKKKLLAVAVAGVLAAPVAAFAQSSVTISGAVRVSIDNLKFSQPAATRTTTSEGRLNDESSSIIFDVREDLGGGMSAIVRVDWKPNIDTSADAASGASYIGLATRTAGRFTAGRHNFHFFKTPWDGYGLGGTLKLHPTSLMDFAGAGAVGMANATRTNNSLLWSSPNWSGFAMDVGYSFNPTSAGAEADMTAGNTARKGRGVYLNPTFSGKNWHVAYSYWSGKFDAPATGLATADQRGDTLYGFYTWGGFKVGAIWNKSKLDQAAAGALGAVGTKISDRSAWSIPVRYSTGNHHFLGHYTKARDDKATVGADGAKMWALQYSYSLSKRTAVSFGYGKITNDAAAAYNLFTSTSGGGLSSVNAGAGANEDPRLLTFGMMHSF